MGTQTGYPIWTKGCWASEEVLLDSVRRQDRHQPESRHGRYTQQGERPLAIQWITCVLQRWVLIRLVGRREEETHVEAGSDVRGTYRVC